MPIADILVENAQSLIPAMAVFIRISALLFFLPGIGETSVSMRIRLAVAFCLAILIMPILSADFPVTNPSLSDALGLFIIEAICGLLLGLSLRFMVFTLQILGNIMSQSLSISQVLGEGIATEPNTTISTLLMITGVTMLVTVDLHIEALSILIESFDIFPIGHVGEFKYITYWLSKGAMRAFALGVSLAIPFIVLNFVYNLILGFLNRAMPQLMVSFVGMPAITGAGLFLMVVATGGILTTWLGLYFQTFDGFGELAP